jgi:hypothetical protein
MSVDRDKELIDLLARELQGGDAKESEEFLARLVLAVDALSAVLATIESATSPSVALAALGEVCACRLAAVVPADNRAKFIEWWWPVLLGRIEAKVRLREEAATAALLEEVARATKH